MRSPHQILRARQGSRLHGALDAPGDKSISHRALILGALAEGSTSIDGLLESEDVLATARAVEQLGATVSRLGEGRWSVTGGAWSSPQQSIDCGNSGTAARLLIGAAAGRGVTARFTGDPSLSRRPMRRILDPLRRMGAEVEGGDTLPLTIIGRPLGGIDYRSPIASAQVKSALLLAGLGAAETTSVTEPMPSRDHSERMLPLFGVDVEAGASEHGYCVRLRRGQRPRATAVTVPGDLSSAAFPLVAALLVPGSAVTLRGVGINPGRTGLIDTLREMGADIRMEPRPDAGNEPRADLHVRASALRAVRVPAARAPAMIDEYPVLAVAAAFAEGETVMEGISELRVKESDRAAAIVAGLQACGGSARLEGDRLVVPGGGLSGGARVASEGDHRIAMSFLVAGLAAAAAIEVDGAGMIDTSYPGFAAQMRFLGANVEEVP